MTKLPTKPVMADPKQSEAQIARAVAAAKSTPQLKSDASKKK